MKKIKDQICNAQNRRSGEMMNNIFETYKNSVMPHGKHMLRIAYVMAISTICTYPLSKHALSHRKCVLRCCEKCTFVDLPIP